MKKIVVMMIITLIAFMALITTSKAATFEMAMTPSSTEVKQGDKVNVVVSVKNMNFEKNGLIALTSLLEYDTNVFNTLQVDQDYNAVQLTSLNKWDTPILNPKNNKIVTARGGYLKTDSDVFSIEFNVKSTAKLGSTTISLKDIKGSNNENDITTPNVSTVLQISEKTTQAPEDDGNTEQPIVNVKPKITVTQEKVSNGIKVTLTSDKELALTANWQLSEDKKQLSRVYTSDYVGTITIKDANGIESEPIVLDVKLGDSETPNNQGGNGSNTEKPGNTGNSGNSSNSGNNGNSEGSNNTGSTGNSGAVEDKTPPTAAVKYAKGTTGVTVTVVANEELKPLDGWTLSADKKTLTKLYTADFSGTITIQDLAGNKSAAIKIDVDVDGKDGNGSGSGSGNNNNNNDNNGGGSQSKDPLPKTGAGYIVPVIALVAIIGTGAFIRYKSMEY